MNAFMTSLLQRIKGLAGYYTGGWWRNPGQAPSSLPEWGDFVAEKIRTAVTTGTITFLPHLDTLTEENDTIRAAYPVMIREPAVKAALLTKVLAVAALDVQVHPLDAKNPEHQRQADFVAHAFARVKGKSRRLARITALPALINGWSLSEKVWAVEDLCGQWEGKWIWKAWKSKDTRGLDLGTDPFRNITGIKARAFNAGRLYDPEDFVIYSYLDMYENPSGMSDLRAAYRAYWIKNTVWQLRGLHLDKYTSPFLMGTYPAGAHDIRAALETALAKARASTWLTIPTGALVTATEMSARGTADYESALQDCDREILIGIMGSYLSILEGKTTGARAMGEVHQDTAELFQWMLAADLGDLYTEQAAELVRLNFAEPAPPTVTLEAISEADLLARSQVDLNLQQLGLKLSKKEAYKAYARTEPEDDEDTLTPAASASPAPSIPGFSEGESLPFVTPPGKTP